MLKQQEHILSNQKYLKCGQTDSGQTDSSSKDAVKRNTAYRNAAKWNGIPFPVHAA